MKKQHTRRKRHTEKQALRFGKRAKRKHSRVGGRTGYLHRKRLAAGPSCGPSCSRSTAGPAPSWMPAVRTHRIGAGAMRSMGNRWAWAAIMGSALGDEAWWSWDELGWAWQLIPDTRHGSLPGRVLGRGVFWINYEIFRVEGCAEAWR